MKHTINLFLFGFLICLFQAGEIYDVALNDIDGQPIDLSGQRGKNMLILVLPGEEADTRMTVSLLTSFASSHGSLTIIGVPAEEWGYTSGTKAQLKSLYSGLPSNFILAAGVKVRKEAGDLQAPLFQWLTDKNRNGHFDRDIPAVGEKFFIDERGRLYGVLNANMDLDNPLIERVLTKARSSQQ